MPRFSRSEALLLKASQLRDIPGVVTVVRSLIPETFLMRNYGWGNGRRSGWESQVGEDFLDDVLRPSGPLEINAT